MTDAIALAITAIANMVTKMIEGQPPEVKKQMWEWYIEDVKWWRNLIHIPPPK